MRDQDPLFQTLCGMDWRGLCLRFPTVTITCKNQEQTNKLKQNAFKLIFDFFSLSSFWCSWMNLNKHPWIVTRTDLIFFISYNYLLFIILFITYFIFMLCPQLASAKYVDTWIPYYRKLTLHEIKVLEINAT